MTRCHILPSTPSPFERSHPTSSAAVQINPPHPPKNLHQCILVFQIFLGNSEALDQFQVYRILEDILLFAFLLVSLPSSPLLYSPSLPSQQLSPTPNSTHCRHQCVNLSNTSSPARELNEPSSLQYRLNNDDSELSYISCLGWIVYEGRLRISKCQRETEVWL